MFFVVRTNTKHYVIKSQTKDLYNVLVGIKCTYKDSYQMNVK